MTPPGHRTSILGIPPFVSRGSPVERHPEEPFSRLIRSDYLHREFPVLIARVKQAKRQIERWSHERG